MKFPLGKKGFLATAALTAGVVYWRVRIRSAEEEERWREELEAATEEGMAAAQAARARVGAAVSSGGHEGSN